MLRNPRRTSTALAAVGFGVIAFVLAAGFVDWMFYAMRESTIRSQLGHIQVTRAGFRSRGVAQPNDYLLPEQSEQISEILRRPEVSVVAPRLSFSGLASFENATISFVGEGVDPANEALLTTHVNIVDGSFISQSDPYGLFIGVGLAENLGVQVGDTLALVASTTGGGINAIEAHVRGVFRSASKAFDDSALRLPISSARELTKMRGSHRWVIGLRQTEQTDVILADLRRELASADTRFELVPWFELAHFYNKTIALFGRQLTVLQGVIAVLIVLTISNALVMSVLERTSEIGTMMALGQRRAQILRLFLTESVLLGALGSILGAALGLMLAHAISAIGIPMPPPPGGTEGYIGEIRTSSEIVGSAMLTSLLAAAAAGVYPSWRASRLQIVDALRHSR